MVGQTQDRRLMFKFYEFFAGAGMARCGLGESWNCLFANDFDEKKGQTYGLNWHDDTLIVSDIHDVTSGDLPDRADLAWASFPCQDLSLAGNGAGLSGERSGTFWRFWELMRQLREEDRAPQVIALENVVGTLTSHDGQDFRMICESVVSLGYRIGAMTIDAADFVPQSRPRLFVVAVRSEFPIPEQLSCNLEESAWSSSALRRAFESLPAQVKDNWIWWRLPSPAKRNVTFADLIEDNPTSVHWHSTEETNRLLSMMNSINLAKVDAAMKQNSRVVGTLYKRTRRDEHGEKVQRAEVRFDDVAGCLRTPAGGSSRQLIMLVDGDSVRSRLISSRETARLMGLPDEYQLPNNYYDAYHLTGDGVVVPVVRHISEHLFEPLLSRGIDAQVAAE